MAPPRLEWLARVLTITAGFVDAVGYVALFRLFTAHQSGNSVGLGVALSGGDWTDVWRRGTAIGCYVLGIALGTILVEVTRQGHARWSGAALAVAELAGLGLAIGLGLAFGVGHSVPLADSGAYAADAAALAGAMGLQAVLLRRLGGHTVRTTFITGMLTNMAEMAVVALFTPERCHRRVAGRFSGLLGSLWLIYIAGAVLGGLAQRAWPFEALGIPMAVTAGLAVWLVRSGYQPSLPEPGQG